MKSGAKPTDGERAALRSFLAVNPIEVTIWQHLTDARVRVRCVFCASVSESAHSVGFPARPTLAHGIACPWLTAAIEFPDLYRPRCHYCPGSPAGAIGEPCAHCQRPVVPGQYHKVPFDI